MLSSLLKYLVVLVIFLVIDFIWLGFAAKKMYSKHLGYLMKKSPNFIAAFIFYALFIVGLYLFVLVPALEKQSIVHALKWGALYGLVTYATYDLTNLATLEKWPIKITIIDLIWGTFVSSLSAVLGFLAIRAIW